jgi:Spy/CpxP family protein refolding chaperone
MNETMTALRSPRAQGLLVLLAVFVSGALCGTAVTSYVLGRRGAGPRDTAMAEGRTPQAEEGRDEDRGIPSQLMQLGLADDQRAQMRRALAERKPAADSIMEAVQPRIRELELNTRQELMCVLTPAQRQRWVDWRAHEGLSATEGDVWLVRVHNGTCGGNRREP